MLVWFEVMMVIRSSENRFHLKRTERLNNDPKNKRAKNLAVIVRRVREVSRSIRTGLRIGSRRAEVGSTINKVLPVRGAQDQTNVWAKSPCSSLDGGAAGAASRPLHFLHHIRKGEEQNHLRRPHSSGRGDTERIRRTKRRR